MLTRIEIDGFKSFANFALDLTPFTVILGPNASGKSNLFDAIQLLRRSVGGTLLETMKAGRGELNEIFRVRGDGLPVDRLRFAVEVIVRPTVVDPFEGEVSIDQTRLRYELEIERRPDSDHLFPDAVDPDLLPYVVREAVIPIRRSEDSWAAGLTIDKEFRQQRLRYSENGRLLLSTGTSADGVPEFRLVGRDAARNLSARSAEATVLSSITTANDYPLLFALRREIAAWRTLHLDPRALRQPAAGSVRIDQLTEAGANLPTVLRRIEAAEGGALMADLVADLSRMIRGVTDVLLLRNPATEEWEIRVATRDEGEIGARVASDGTLRILAVLAALYDPDGGGVLCFEEPENGVHPQRLRDFISLIRNQVSDLSEYFPDAPTTQALITSHSPLFLLAKPAENVVVLDWVSRREFGSSGERKVTSRITRARRLVKTAHAAGTDEQTTVVSLPERSLMTGILPDEAKSLLGA